MRIPVPFFIRDNLCSGNLYLWRWFWLREYGGHPLPASDEEAMDLIGGWYYDWRKQLPVDFDPKQISRA